LELDSDGGAVTKFAEHCSRYRSVIGVRCMSNGWLLCAVLLAGIRCAVDKFTLLVLLLSPVSYLWIYIAHALLLHRRERRGEGNLNCTAILSFSLSVSHPPIICPESGLLNGPPWAPLQPGWVGTPCRWGKGFCVPRVSRSNKNDQEP
jgi:hypothetical protein